MICSKIKNLTLQYEDHYNLLKQNELQNIVELNKVLKIFDSEVKNHVIPDLTALYVRMKDNKYLILLPAGDKIALTVYDKINDTFSEKLYGDNINLLLSQNFIEMLRLSKERFISIGQLESIYGIDFDSLIKDIIEERKNEPYRDTEGEYNFDSLDIDK